MAALSFRLAMVSPLVPALTERINFLWFLFEITLAFGSVGLSTGISADLSLVRELTVIATLYLGRTGSLPLAVGLAGREAASRVRYVEEHVKIG